DPVTLTDGDKFIKLWGVENIEGGAAFVLKARTALDNAIGDQAVQCEIKERRGAEIFAQCVNARDLDLGLFMLQQGYVSADRATLSGSIFEDAYVQAETDAQKRNVGVWSSRRGNSAVSR